MSTFKVTVERIEKVWDHPNADRLSLAKVEGMNFQFVVPKDQYRVGQLIIYFPVDSLLPQDLIAHFGIGNFLAGKDKNRLKTVRLRGEVSQGFVCDYADPFISLKMPICGRRFQDDGVTPWSDVGMDITSELGVTKYEPPEIPCKAGNLVQLPEGVPVYDIEGCQRYPRVVDKLMDQKVFITEKAEGSNHATTIFSDGTFAVCQRNFSIVPIEGHVHDWWKAAEEAGHFNILKKAQEKNPGKQITIRSEVCGNGISGNIYKIKGLQLFAFDVMIDGKYLDAQDFLQFCSDYGLKTVPVLGVDVTLREWLNGKTVVEASNGTTAIPGAKCLREGVVIRPMLEQHDDILGGRLFLKQRDPIYLDKTGN